MARRAAEVRGGILALSAALWMGVLSAPADPGATVGGDHETSNRAMTLPLPEEPAEPAPPPPEEDLGIRPPPPPITDTPEELHARDLAYAVTPPPDAPRPRR